MEREIIARVGQQKTKHIFSSFYSVEHRVVKIKGATGKLCFYDYCMQVKGNEVIYIPAHTLVKTELYSDMKQDIHIDMVLMSNNYIRYITQELIDLICNHTHGEVKFSFLEDRINLTFDNIIRLLIDNNNSRNLLVESLSIHLFHHIIRSSSSGILSGYTGTVPVIEQITSAVQSDLTAKWNKHNIADRLNMSPDQLENYLKKEKIDYISVIHEIRIAESVRLLLTTNLSIADIAIRCGYNDLPYFSKVFKHRKRISPKKFRDTFHQSGLIDQNYSMTSYDRPAHRNL